MNLSLFFVQQADQFVVLLDGFERLDKDGLSAGTGAVDDALDAPFLLDLYRDHKARAPDGGQFVLHRSAFGEFAGASDPAIAARLLAQTRRRPNRAERTDHHPGRWLW